MATVTTISDSVFAARKDEAKRNQILRKELHLSEFDVEGNTIKIDGARIPLSKHAYKKLLTRLRIPNAFAKRFNEKFGEDGLSQLMTMMKSSKDMLVTLIVDTKTREISDLLPEGYASISNESFVDFAERYIDQYNLGVTHFGSDDRGGCIINTISDKGIFQVPGMTDETFQTGVSFRNDPVRGLEVTPFLNRLICTNGMSSTAFEERFQLRNLSDNKINEFNNHMLSLASTGFQPMGFIEQIKKANNTEASIAEMQTAMNAVLATNKAVTYDFAQRFVPVERSMRAYKTHGVEVSQLTKKQLQTASSGMTVWQLVNGMTNFASNQNKFNINDNQMGNLMIKSGNLMMKENYDTEGLLNVNPFANDLLLNESQANRIMGNTSLN